MSPWNLFPHVPWFYQLRLSIVLDICMQFWIILFLYFSFGDFTVSAKDFNLLHTPSSASYDALFEQFDVDSRAAINEFKRQYLKILQQQSSDLFLNKNGKFMDRYEIRATSGPLVFQIEHPPFSHRFPHFENVQLISFPSPNVASDGTGSQLLVTINYEKELNILQFFNHSSIFPINPQNYRTDPKLKEYEFVKMRSFVQPFPLAHNQRVPPHFRLHIAVLSKHKYSIVAKDQIHMFSFDGYLNPSHSMIIELIPCSWLTNGIVLNSEQLIEHQTIHDFDLITLGQPGGSRGSRYFMALIKQSIGGNLHFELKLHYLRDTNFDHIASHNSEYIFAANRVKLAQLNGQLHFICTYTHAPSGDVFGSMVNAMNIFRYTTSNNLYSGVRDENQEPTIEFVSAVQNEAFIGTIRGIFHFIDDNVDYFFLLKHDSIFVYWWDGTTLIYYDTIQDKVSSGGERIRGFALTKHRNILTPLILSNDGHGRAFTVHYKVRDQFIMRKETLTTEMDRLPDGFELRRVEAFVWANRFYVWTLYHHFGGVPQNHDSVRSFGYIAHVVRKQPEHADEFLDYEQCVQYMQIDLEKEIQQQKDLSRISEQLLIVSPTKPELDVDVIVDEEIRSVTVPEEVNLVINTTGKITGKSLEGFINSTQARLHNQYDYMWTNVMMKSTNQTVVAPVQFERDITVTNQFKISRVESPFFLVNGIEFEVYASNSLNIDGDQVLEYHSSDGGEVIFREGLIVGELSVKQVNRQNILSPVFVAPISATQSIAGRHHFRHLELLNGTTAPIINDVRLIDLFQDTPDSVQLMRAPKNFANLTVVHIATDSSFNSWNMRDFESQVIWLDNDNLETQNFFGNLLEFHGTITASLGTKITGTINQRFDLETFARLAARSDREITLLGPIHFHNRAHAWDDVNYAGLLNGQFDLHRDVILLYGDQDFISTSAVSLLQFETLVSMQNVTIGTLNGAIRTADFVRRQDFLSEQALLLSDKTWLNDLQVNGNIILADAVTVNGVDISELHHRLDSFTTFNTPLSVDQIDIEESLESFSLNSFNRSEIYRILTTRLSKKLPQSIDIPISYSLIKANNLIFNATGSGQYFPRDYISIEQAQATENIDIYGRKWFTGSASINRLEFGPNGHVGEHRIAKIFESVVKNDTTYRNRTENIFGKKRFDRLVVKGNLFVEDGLLNDCFLDKAVTIDDSLIEHQYERRVMKKLWFDNVAVIDGSQIEVKDLTIKHSLNNENFERFLNEVIIITNQIPESNMEIYLSNKHFRNGIASYEIRIDANATIGGIALYDLMRSALIIDGRHSYNFYSNAHFSNAFFERIDKFRTIGGGQDPGLDKSYFERVVLKSSSPIRIDARKTFHKNIFAVKIAAHGAHINDYNLTHIVHNSLMRFGDQIVSAKHIFLRPLHMIDFRVLPHVRLNDRLFQHIVRLDQKDIWFNHDVIFERLNRIQSLTVSGLVDQCNLTEVRNSAILRRPSDGTFELDIEIAVPSIVVNGNTILPNIVNGQPNFVANIALVNDRRPFSGQLRFTEDLVTENAVIHSRVNRINVTELLNDAIYMHVPSIISGHKSFRRPLKIFGFVRQLAKHSPGITKVPPPQLHVGLVNAVNVSNLFSNTVMKDQSQLKQSQSIFGNKIFYGDINFNGKIRVHTLNQLPVPGGYYLRHTNELITGETYFTKRVHVHENLNARLINRFNLTQFVHNCIFLQPALPSSLAKHFVQPEITSILTFVDRIYIRDLIVRTKINDIPVSDLLHQDSNATVYGYKMFENPIVVKGNLDLGTVNSIDFERDLKGEWIDTRSQSLPINITGRIVFRRPTDVNQLLITKRINSFGFDQFTPKYFSDLNRKVMIANETIGNEMKTLDRIDRSMEKRSSLDYLDDLKYFWLVQNFVDPIIEFVPISYFTGFTTTGKPLYRADSLFAMKLQRTENLTHYCEKIETRYFESLTTQSMSASKHKLLREITLPAFGRLPADLNMHTTVIQSISLGNYSSEWALIYTIRSPKKICWPLHLRQSYNYKASVGYVHLVGVFATKYFPNYQIPMIELSDERHSISSVKMFAFTSTIKYLVVLNGDASLKIYRMDLNGQKSELIQILAPQVVVSFDLIEIVAYGQNRSSILMSLVTISNHPQLFRWNIASQRFEIYPSGPAMMLHFESLPPLQTTKFIRNDFGTFLLLTSGSRAEGDFCGVDFRQFVTSTSRTAIFSDIWQWNGETFQHRQRLVMPTAARTIRGIESIQIGESAWYLLILANGDHQTKGHGWMYVYAYQGYSRFELAATYPVPGAVTISTFWNDHMAYVALGSTFPFRSQLLAANTRFYSESESLIHSENWSDAVEQMKQYNSRELARSNN